jgi:GH18 family chitinase
MGSSTFSYAKWFGISNKDECKNDPKKCKFVVMQTKQADQCPTIPYKQEVTADPMSVVDCGTSSAFRFQPKNNANTFYHDVKLKSGGNFTIYENAQASYGRVPWDSEEKGIYDSDAKASLWVDDQAEFPLLWSWQSPKGMKETCDGLKELNVGGYMIWSLGGDNDKHSHIKALQESCWKHE